MHVGKCGNLVVRALAFGARGHGFDPRGRRGNISVSEHAFLSVICRDDTKYVRHPSDLDVNWRPHVQVKNPSVVYRGARWLCGRVSDSGARGRGFDTYRRRVVSLSKTLYSPKVLVNYPGSGGSVPT